MNIALRVIVLYFFSVCASSHLGAAWSDTPQYRKPFPLPDCPAGCVIVLYGPIPPGMMGAKSEHTDDWKQILIERGIRFPKGGFALFYRPGRMLAVATDENNQDTVSVLAE